MTTYLSPYISFLRSRVGNELLIMPSASAVIFDPSGSLLVVRHSEGNVWVLPGGAIEPNEAPEDAVIREVHEETGLAVSPQSIVGVYGGPDFEVTYRNGDRVTYINTIFRCATGRYDPVPDGDEVLEARFLPLAELRRLNLARWLGIVLPDIEAARDAAATPAKGSVRQ